MIEKYRREISLKKMINTMICPKCRKEIAVFYVLTTTINGYYDSTFDNPKSANHCPNCGVYLI